MTKCFALASHLFGVAAVDASNDNLLLARGGYVWETYVTRDGVMASFAEGGHARIGAALDSFLPGVARGFELIALDDAEWLFRVFLNASFDINS